ncbi:MAG TPA: TetR/AcrR family transcriptional regulator, partial [Gaiellaceae bacterium]|nr:TetR/AcrR family transcriptional regulator [Gaiellaceae bacterium]
MTGRSLMIDVIETKPSLRRRIIEAADALIRAEGLSGATTRRIARAAGCAEGSIYVHFEDKIDLVIAVIVEREPSFPELLELPARAGESTVEANLVPWVGELLELMRLNQPIFFALMSDRALFARFKERLREREAGPVALFRAAEAYVRAEQELGRVTSRVSPQVAATILVGACRDQVLTQALAGKKPISPERFARELVRALVHGLGDAP